MAIQEAMEALAEHWDDVASQLPPEQVSQLRELVRQLRGPDPGRAADQITDLLIDWLSPRHPVRRALADTDLSAPATLDWDRLAADLLERLEAEMALDSGPPGGDDEPPSVDEILRVVTERLLAAPALSEQQVRQRGADPADPGLIKLTRPDGGQQWPLFQFTRDNGPLPVVRTINTMLHAARDPIGVADWWLSRNSWLDSSPSQLLGQASDEALLGAARAIRTEV